eukprot:TRINITY_DN7941_c1_g1_i1.p1 TRINITY_DN7941_c1_g1~~TRINITY_DN7941_c1_g1_i1.p1  ORF type:complete len:1246 (+),score=418.01 TRINITY_DN7941_c1_g1_i1:119-3739(+)
MPGSPSQPAARPSGSRRRSSQGKVRSDEEHRKLGESVMGLPGMFGETMRGLYAIDELSDRHDAIMEGIQGFRGPTATTKAAFWAQIKQLSDRHSKQQATLRQLVAADQASQSAGKADAAQAAEWQEKILELLESRDRLEIDIKASMAEMQQHNQRALRSSDEREELRLKIATERQQTRGAESARAECERWADEARTRIAVLEKLEREFQKRSQQSGEREAADRAMLIVQLRQQREQQSAELASADRHVSRLELELAQWERKVRREQQNRDLHQSGTRTAERDHAASDATWRQEIKILRGRLQEEAVRIRKWEEFEAAHPGHADLERHVAAKGDALREAKERVVGLHGGEQELEKDLSEGWRDVGRATGELQEAVDALEAALGGRLSEVCPEETLVSCYPDPCPVGQALHVIITTCDADRRPVAGAGRDEIAVRRLDFSAHGAVSQREALAVDAVLDKGCPSSTFIASFHPEADGRAGFRISFRGQEFTASACVPPPPPPMLREVMAVAAQQPPALTVHCSPGSAAVGDHLRVAVVMREPGSFLPMRSCTVPAEDLRPVSYGTLYGLRPPPLRQLREASPVYELDLVLPTELAAQGSARHHVGVEVMAPDGSEAARGSVPLVATPSADQTACPGSSVLVCLPDPACCGERVQVFISARNQHRHPVPNCSPEVAAVLAPRLAAVGTATEIEQPVQLQDARSLVWAGAFTADRVGRAGVCASFPGRESARMRSTVTVHPAAAPVPEMTLLELTPAAVQLGETVCATVTTCDADGRAVPGPPPGSMQLQPVGCVASVLPLRRVDGSLCRYTAVLRTAGSAAAKSSAGCTLQWEQFRATARVRVTGVPLDAPTQQAPPPAPQLPAAPRNFAAFLADPVPRGGECLVLLAAYEDAPAKGPRTPQQLAAENGTADAIAPSARSQAGRVPQLWAAENCTVVRPPEAVHGSKALWQAVVRVGETLGTASVDATFAGGAGAHGSTTVAAEHWDDLDQQLSRLRGLCGAALDAASAEHHRAARLAHKEKQLQGGHRGDGSTGLYLLFGLQLSDGIHFSGLWEPFDGCKVIEVIHGGPVAQAKQLDGIAVRFGDFAREVRWTDPESGRTTAKRVQTLDQFRRLCEELSLRYPVGDAPPVTLTFTRRSEGTLPRDFRIEVFTDRTPAPPGRFIGTLRHTTTRAIDTAGAGSPQRSRAGSPFASSPHRASPRPSQSVQEA